MSAIQTTTTTTTKNYDGDNKYHNDNDHIGKKYYISLSHNTNEKKPRRRRRRRVVRFSLILHIKHTISINDMTHEEIANTWIQQDEDYKIRQQCQELIALEGTGAAHECLRGLESHTKYGKIEKDTNRYESKMLVMNEQDQQYVDDCLDEEKISSLYKDISNKCQIDAQFMAQKDRSDVERYYTNKNESSTHTTTTTIRSSTGIITLSKPIASAA